MGVKQKKVVSKTDKAIPLCQPKIQGREWQYIKECLDTNWVSSAGKYVEKFEAVVAGRIGRRYAVACVNGTAALHIALLVAGIGPDDEVLLPTITFVAPANAVRYVGAWPVFMDVQPDIWQIDPQKIRDFLSKECDRRRGKVVNRRTKRTIKAILPVHILGHSVDLDPILDIARQYDLKVIEDAAESLGAGYKDRPVGSQGDIACFSFNGNKIITTGGGGMLLTDREEWAERARYLTTQAKDDPLENIHGEIGYNYRLTNIQAAMGVAQMELLDEYVEAKRAIAVSYERSFKTVKGITPQGSAPWARSAFWLYTVLVNSKEYGMDSRELLRKLLEGNVETRPLWHPIHSLKPFEGCYAHRIEVAPRLYRDALSLPSSVGMSDQDQQRVVRLIQELGIKR